MRIDLLTQNKELVDYLKTQLARELKEKNCSYIEEKLEDKILYKFLDFEQKRLLTMDLYFYEKSYEIIEHSTGRIIKKFGI